MSSDSVKLMSLWVSVFGMRVMIALKEKGVEYEYQEEVLANKSQLLLSSNPVHKKVPVLIHNGKPISESLIVVEYIDETWPSQEKCGFLPKDPYQRAVTRFWTDFVDRKVYGAGYEVLASPEGERHEQARKDFTDALVTLESGLLDVAGGKPYFGGDSIGLVDIAFAPILCWFRAYESVGLFNLSDGVQCPHLAEWYEKLAEDPSIKETLATAPPDKVFEFGENMRKRILGAQATP